MPKVEEKPSVETPSELPPVDTQEVKSNKIDVEFKQEQQSNLPENEEKEVTTSQGNVIFGKVVDDKGASLIGAIVEVQDQKYDLVRRMQTGKDGKFTTASPLENGSYKLIASFESRKFEDVEVTLDGNSDKTVVINQF